MKIKILVFVLLYIILISFIVFAEPSGADITYSSTDVPDPTSPDNRTNDGGTITTLVVDAVQQNIRWKAYIGNITGKLTLDDSAGSTIFEWVLAQEDITGEIYASRSNNVNWSSISCANSTIISSEQTALSMNATSVDSISNTFNETIHPPITVGINTVNNCPATSTFVSSTRQSQGSADFPLVLVQDSTNIIYTTPINPSTTGYDSSLFDFQLILANNPSSSTTYYFYVELGG